MSISSENTLQNSPSKVPILSSVEVNGEHYFKISDVDCMRPFFMSLVSDTNHWMFVSSNGALTTGRKNAQFALFPYYTDDKITESAENTGSKTIVKVTTSEGIKIWEPFSQKWKGYYNTTNNLYKNAIGNKLLFEEINHDLQLTFSYQWNFSTNHGFVKKSRLSYFGEGKVEVTIVDGLQNILPSGVGSDLQNRSSNLVDAYKRTELDVASGLGMYTLSAIITDKAEPSEALKCNVVYSLGIDNATHLLSSTQLDYIRKGRPITQEVDIKAEKGAYFVVADVTVKSNEAKEWMTIANVNQTQTAVINTINKINTNFDLSEQIEQDIVNGTAKLLQLVGSADGIQTTADGLTDTRHYANVLFNIMRGGIFDHNYDINRDDFTDFLAKSNKVLYAQVAAKIASYPVNLTLFELKAKINELDNPDLHRLATEYLPLKFSRRHGDPSRPWNVFSINTNDEVTGAKVLDYQGNWRDIFQNWEALATSYPYFIEGMISKFLNASTFDGYNPYRVNKIGFDWETIEPDDPWSYIGYWGDHQIIYLLKFLEFAKANIPNLLGDMAKESCFVYANVPYKIKSYQDICHNPKDTIDFDHHLDLHIRKLAEEQGSDAALLTDNKGVLIHVNFIEKVLVTLLSKLTNLVVDGGIWLNTQRPEWNDANNALVGNGTSMVTVYYLRRFLTFLESYLVTLKHTEVMISEEVSELLQQVNSIFEANSSILNQKVTDTQRRSLLDELGIAGSNYREQVYTSSFTGNKREVTINDLKLFVNISLHYINHSIDANLREDELYHGYNLLTLSDNEASVSHLAEMLEGQVAALSSGKLSPEESLKVLNAMAKSSLYRADQQSYILYPNKELKGFLQKNTINKQQLSTYDLNDVEGILIEKGILSKNNNGDYHFNADFRNGTILTSTLQEIDLSKKDVKAIGDLYEEVFYHKGFTGRSGTFYGYEGLGSIYWHMVSKLRLAVLEICQKAYQLAPDSETYYALTKHYYAIAEGIGVHKPVEVYGAFTTDPYSHTPSNKGAQQPGMTGQVKEDILCRWGELGITTQDGQLHFNTHLLSVKEFKIEPSAFHYYDVRGDYKEVPLPSNSLAFTYCQVPIIYQIQESNLLTISYANGEVNQFDKTSLDEETTAKLFRRDGTIRQITVGVTMYNLLKNSNNE